MMRSSYNNRGQGLSVNMIILIALGLLILIIAILLVNRSGKSLSESATASCISKGGICRDVPQSGEIEIKDVSCKENGVESTKRCYRFNFGGDTTP